MKRLLLTVLVFVVLYFAIVVLTPHSTVKRVLYVEDLEGEIESR